MRGRKGRREDGVVKMEGRERRWKGWRERGWTEQRQKGGVEKREVQCKDERISKRMGRSEGEHTKETQRTRGMGGGERRGNDDIRGEGIMDVASHDVSDPTDLG